MRNRNIGEKHLKNKIFLSYILIIALISSIIYFTFNSFQQLTESSDALAQPNPRIGLLHKMIFTIYNAESNIRSYTLNEDEEILNAYFVELSRINEMVDSLYLLAGNDSFFLQTIDSINIQLLKKTQLLEQFIELKRYDQNSIFYQRALKEIVQITEKDSRVKEITHQTIVEPQQPEIPTEATSEEIAEERQSGFSRFWNSIFRRGDQEPDDEMFADELEEESVDSLEAIAIEQIRTDSIITIYRDTDELKDDLENTLMRLARSMMQKQEELLMEENRLLIEDKKIMDRIWAYVTMLEDYERVNAVREAQNAHSTVKSTTEKIFIIVIFSLLVLIAFSLFVISDINKSRFYKNQLEHAKNRAEDLLQVKRRFMANISHEIRTPLNSIIGFSKQLEKKHHEKEQKTFVNAINQSSVHLLNMVNDILDFSKIEAGKIYLEDTYLNIKDVAEEVHNTLHIIAKEKKLHFTINTKNLNNYHVSGDPIRIRQILLNIAGNAIKFTEKGSVKMFLSDYVKIENPDISYVSVKITDTGVGIAPADQKRIFEEFAQSDNQVSRKFGGTGLGLSISKKLVELMSGSIDLVSRKGKGTTFTIHLPLKIAEKPDKKLTIEPLKTDKKLTAKILLVEDDKLNRLLLKSVFTDFPKISLTEAEDAIKGLELIQNVKFNLIITDIQMPGMSGIEMVREMKQLPDSINYRTPILAFTADITQENIIEIQQNGIDDFIPKPVDEDQLMNKISGLLKVERNFNLTEEFDEKNHQENLIVNEKNTSGPVHNLYDLAGLKRFTGNDTKSLTMLMEAFIEDTEKHISELQEGIKLKNLQSISQVAHKMSNMLEILIVNDTIQSLKNLSRIKENKISDQEIEENVAQLIGISKKLLINLKADLEELTVKDV